MISAFFHGWNNVMILFAIFGVIIFIAVIMCVMKGRHGKWGGEGGMGKTVAFEQEVEVVKETLQIKD